MSLLKWIGMGQTKNPSAEGGSAGTERYFGFENFGNTCYLNAVLQALYFCRPFRECVLNYPNGPMGVPPTPMPPTPHESITPNMSVSSLSSGKRQNSKEMAQSVNSTSGSKERAKVELGQIPSTNPVSNAMPIPPNSAPEETISCVPGMEESIFTAMKELFWKIQSQRKRNGVLAPSQFITKLRKENEIYRSTMHQDAHEFLNYILNTIAEDVQVYEKNYTNEASLREGRGGAGEKTWVHQLFEGELTNETKCLTCETVTNREESFLDLSIDIEENSSVTSCLRQFSASEMLCHKNKFFCDICCSLQEAEKRMKIKKLPNILALHLKRFKYQENIGKFVKLSYRVAFPLELRLFNTSDKAEDPDRLYSLFAVVVHLGSGPHHGHYISLIKSMGNWLIFDDDSVETIDESDLHKYFGNLPGSGSGYVLFYEAQNLDITALGVPCLSSSPTVTQSSWSPELANGMEHFRLQNPPNRQEDQAEDKPEDPKEKEERKEREKNERKPSWFSGRRLGKKEKKSNEDVSSDLGAKLKLGK
ncbi:cysteine proteinase [Basidiobolus meristosporus CBS 931.73]|uniref:Ubiquitin carboxyl-terminal hydrolase n=1 Tax=Basidiobolus meristosporus CBS 931.73 TaxID=1314790 RepID=A0A1Y1WZ80_9FUNG|nr:cysteine proteinase [Basidiobolus meristosporus CBS 931.73]|eukprot:ORX78648.1 cysteine proteinase [Basidiobolus meristosporus CBS 931.73]